MQNSGAATQIIGILTIVGSVIGGFLSFSSGGLGLLIGGVVSGVVLICIGNAFYALGAVAKDTRRGADALDRIAKAQTGVASQLPPDAAKRLQQSRIKPL